MAMAVLAMAVMPAAATGANRQMPNTPYHEGRQWRPDWIIGWRYPYHRVKRNLAPPGCWDRYGVVTPDGIVWRREYICR
ncbi:MAG: hypothetical protein P8Y53_18040 [Pseudolabrys sp.]